MAYFDPLLIAQPLYLYPNLSDAISVVGHECVQCLLQAVKNHCPDQKVVPCLQQTNQGYRYAALDILVIFHPTFLVQMQQPYLFAP